MQTKLPMKKIIKVISLFLLYHTSSFAQFVTFEKTYQFFPTNQEAVKQVITTKDGGYALRTVTSYVSAFDPIYAGVIKLDSMGNKQWEYHFILGLDTRSDFLLETNDNGLLISGVTPTDTGIGNYDLWLLKLDSVGQIEWYNKITAQNWVYTVNEIITLNNGDFIISTNGYSKSNIVVIDSLGTLISWNSYNNLSFIRGLQLKNDSLLFATAARDTTLNRFFMSYILMKTNGSILSTTLWNYELDSVFVAIGNSAGTLNKHSEAICNGAILNSVGNWEGYVMKFDSTGNCTISKKLSLDRTFLIDKIISPNSGGGFVLAGGLSSSNPGLGSGWIYILDDFCDSVSFKFIGNAANKPSIFYDVKQCSDSGFIAVGLYVPNTTEVPYAVKVDKNGNLNNFLGKNNQADVQSELTIYPNPSNEFTYFLKNNISENAQLTISTVAGQLLFETILKNSNEAVKVSTSHFPNGFYICKIKNANGFAQSKKLLVIH